VFDVGVMGLALLAFLLAGYTPDKQSEYSQVTKKCLKWLKDQQDDQGLPLRIARRLALHLQPRMRDHRDAAAEAAGSTTQQTWKKSASGHRLRIAVLKPLSSVALRHAPGPQRLVGDGVGCSWRTTPPATPRFR
jgi:hypothetical protein